MSRFDKTDKPITKLVFSDGETITTEENFCDEIKVEMENGEMAEVAWFACYKDSKLTSKWNSKYVEAVLYR